MELTILMPCLNEAETVARCVDECNEFLEASGVHGEVLVADNGSTDGSPDVALERRRAWCSFPGRASASALLGGMEAAEGTGP